MLFHLYIKIFVRGKAEPKFLVNPQHICQLEEPPVAMNRRRLPNAHKPAAVIDKLPHSRHNPVVQPRLAAGKSRTRRPGVDDNVNILRDPLLLNLIKAQKYHIHAGPAQRLQHPEIGIGLLIPQGMGHHKSLPRPDLSPAVKHSHL